MIHHFPEDFSFEIPSGFTDPFRYRPHPSVIMAARLVAGRIEDSHIPGFEEGKMIGVLVCRQEGGQSLCYIAAFSGNVGGFSRIEGFVPPIYDLADPDGEFRRREAEITSLNRDIDSILTCEEYKETLDRLAETESDYKTSLEKMRSDMSRSKAVRKEMRKNCCDEDILSALERESQHEKAELHRLKLSYRDSVTKFKSRLQVFSEEVETKKTQRALLSESLQDWIFRQYIVHNASGDCASIADIFSEEGLTAPGGTGECAAPKLLEYAYRNHLQPLAMGEFWYGKSPQTAVRTHGHFYPSCTSKCGPLLKFMMKGLSSEIKPTHECHPDPLIIYEDESLRIVEKPSGMPSVPGLDGRTSLQEWLADRHGETHAVHRLDMDTSGVMIFAKTQEAAVNIRKQFEEHSILKTYRARISHHGSLEESSSGQIDLPLSPDYDERPRQKVDIMQGKEAHTKYRIAGINPDGTAEISLYPQTGRTHQLRVHCAHASGLSSPILGDLLYGSYSLETDTTSERLCLHALSITFTHPVTGERVTFCSDRLCY